MAVKKFILHEEGYPYTGTELPIMFARDIATVDPQGDAVAADVPRFDHEVTLASVATPESAFSTSPANVRGRILGTGYDADGQTDLMVWIEYDNPDDALYDAIPKR